MFDVNPHAGGGMDDAQLVEFESASYERPQPDSRLQIDYDDALETIIVAKRRAAFTRGDIDQLRGLVRDIEDGHRGACKFLVFDLGDFAEASVAARGYSALLGEIADLIVAIPVITVAWARGRVAGPDLELAFACSVIVGEPEARFCFDVDLVDSLRTYSVLAHKIGFVRAERIMENAAELDMARMNELMLVTAVPTTESRAGLREFVKARARRHNASCGIYRAQRLAMPAV